MYAHKTQLRVRYSETDQMGQVYYGQYATYFEVGRVEAMRSLGLAYADLEKVHGVFMPVMSMQVRYLRPALYDELLTMTTTIRKFPERVIVFETEVRGEHGKITAAGRVTLCFVDAHSRKRLDVPEFLVRNLRKYFETI